MPSIHRHDPLTEIFPTPVSLLPVYKDTMPLLARSIPQRLRADLRAVWEDMIIEANDAVSVLSKCYSWRSKLLKLLNDTRIFDYACVRHALHADDGKVALLLQTTQETEKKRMMSLRDNDARGLLDTIEHVLDTRRLESKSVPSVSRLLIKIYESSGLMPSSLLLSGVTNVENAPFAHGGFGEVFRANFNGKCVALKRLPIKLHNHELIRKMTIRESMIWQQLRHPNILPFHGMECTIFPLSICMVSSWMPNGTMTEFIKMNDDPSTRKKLVKEVADGLRYMHLHGVVHGDLRGANILIDADSRAVLADFGLTKFAEATSTSSSSAYHGSLRWMAPELFDPYRFDCDRVRKTFATDVYAFACVCLEIYSGHAPFYPGHNSVQVVFQVITGKRPVRPVRDLDGSADIPDDLWGIVQQCWSPKPAGRPSMSDIFPSQ